MTPELYNRLVSMKNADPAKYECILAPGEVAMIVTLMEESAHLRTDLTKLQDPAAVHVNMLRGTIAKISMANCAHTHGVQFNDLEAAEAALAEARAENDRLRLALTDPSEALIRAMLDVYNEDVLGFKKEEPHDAEVETLLREDMKKLLAAAASAIFPQKSAEASDEQ